MHRIRIPVDELVESIEDSMYSIQRTSTKLEHSEALSAQNKEVMRQSLMESWRVLDEQRSRLKQIAEVLRPGFAVERARQLLAMVSVGVLDKQIANELTQHTPFRIQEEYNYPDDLRQSLRSKELIEKIIEISDYEWAIDGQFLD